MPGVLHGYPLPTLNESEIEVPTLDEALAMALSMCPAGQHVTLHEAHCPVTPEDPDTCTCAAVAYYPVRA